MPLTLREVLDLDVVRRGRPRVVAAADRLDRPVRWVHALELTDVGRLLRGGELVLSTGIALPESAAGLEAYIAELAGARVAALAIELGRRYTGALPAALVAAAQARGLPLIAFAREVPFVEITEAVHARIIDALLIERAATTLALGRLLSRQAESLEQQAHRTLISAIIERADADEAEAEARARAMGVPVTGRLLVAAVVRIPRGDDVTGGEGPDALAGRLPPDHPPAPDPPAARGGHSRGGDPPDPPAARGDVVLVDGRVAVLEIAGAVAAACREAGVPALAGALDDVRVGALLSLPPAADPDAVLTALAARLAAQPGSPAAPVIGTGPPATALRDVRRSFLEAREVAEAAARHPGGRPYYRLADLRLRGLLQLLRDDTRVREFAERELGPLLDYDAAHGTGLVADLTAFLEAGGNKALAAARAHLARPTFYERLRRIERVLAVSLAEPESRAGLHVALLTLGSSSGQARREAAGGDRAPAVRGHPQQ